MYWELRVGSGATSAPTAKLQATLPTTETVPVFRADDQDSDPTPFIIIANGNAGIGMKLSTRCRLAFT